MTAFQSLAVFGAAPRFSRPIPTGQRYFPAWPQYEAMFRDVFERQYYTNHGPLAQELELRLADRLGVRHAMCVTNEFIGLALAGQALGVRGDVVVPAHSSIATSLSLQWTEGSPLLCDVDLNTGMMTAELVAPLLSRQPVSAILAVNPWGDACDVEGLQVLANSRGIPLYIDSAQGFGCAVAGRPIGGFGCVEVISFHSDNIVGACEGGVICTQDDDLAARIRNMRSNYGMGPPVPVDKTANGRMSEAQAAVALFNLAHYSEYQRRNKLLHERFRTGLEGIPGLEIRIAAGVSESNYQNLICRVDEAVFGLCRDDLQRILLAENLQAGRGFDPLPNRAHLNEHAAASEGPLNAARYAATILELPMHHTLTEAEIGLLLDLLRFLQSHSSEIRSRLSAAA